MRLRIPAGRAGRPWLVHRLAVARRGAEVLDEKRRGLLRERTRVAASVDEARESWEQAAADAETWLRRALLISGRRAFELARFYVPGRAEVQLEWRRSLGVTFPSSAEASLPPTPDLVAPGGSSALARAASGYGRAVAAGAHAAALTSALRRVEVELEATVRRQRALERRWIPEHENALAALALALDEAEREDAVRARWFAEARSSAVAAEPSAAVQAVSTGALRLGPSP